MASIGLPGDHAIGDFPVWFTAIAWVALAVGALCALWVTIDLIRHPQKMAIMNVVWPVTMLFGGVLWLALYARSAPSRRMRARRTRRGRGRDERLAVAISTNHCGAGCMLGDLVAESLLFFVPALAVATGYGWLFSDRMFAVWVWDFLLAFAIGIAFQYFAIAPMRGLSPSAGIRAALKADAASISAWQVGMFGTMALFQLLIYPLWIGTRATTDQPEFWFAMQIAMVVGFCTSYPVNRWLVRAGVKEGM